MNSTPRPQFPRDIVFTPRILRIAPTFSGCERPLAGFESQSIHFLCDVSDGLLACLWRMAVAEQNFHNVPCGLLAAVDNRLFVLFL